MDHQIKKVIKSSQQKTQQSQLHDRNGGSQQSIQLIIKEKNVQCPECNNQIQVYRNPTPTVDIIIEIHGGIVLIERSNPPHGWALPGGFVDYGESFENAAIREAQEETGLTIHLKEQFYTYSNPERDSRQHNSSTVYIAAADGTPQGGDDAAIAKIFTRDSLPHLVFDHSQILSDYFTFMQTGKRPQP